MCKNVHIGLTSTLDKKHINNGIISLFVIKSDEQTLYWHYTHSKCMDNKTTLKNSSPKGKLQIYVYTVLLNLLICVC